MKRINTVTTLIAALAVCGAAQAQLTQVHVKAQPVAHDENSLAERVFQLERANADLTAKVQAQQAQISQLKSQSPSQSQGVTQKDLNDVSVKLWALQSDVSGVKTDLTGLKSKFYTHTHAYSTQHVHYHNIKCESSDSTPQCVHIDDISSVPEVTSPPH